MAFGPGPRLWRIVLAVSLALNLGVAGVLIGAAFDRHGADDQARVAGPAAPLVRALPDAARRGVLNDLRTGPRPSRGRGLDGLIEVLRADPFDPDALRTALRDARRAGDARLERTQEAIIGQLAAMTPSERAQYAENLSKHVRRR